VKAWKALFQLFQLACCII